MKQLLIMTTLCVLRIAAAGTAATSAEKGGMPHTSDTDNRPQWLQQV